MMQLILSFLYALMATLGFSIIFHVPLRHFPAVALIGASGWAIYQICVAFGVSTAIACFLSSFAVGLFSDLASRFFKDAATIFIIPGILCLVPGSGIYNAMLQLVNGNLKEGAMVCGQTLAMAGSIALGLLVVGAVIRIIVAIARRAVNIASKL